MQTGPKHPTSKRAKKASPGRWGLLAGVCWRRPGLAPPLLNHKVHPPLLPASLASSPEQRSSREARTVSQNHKLKLEHQRLAFTSQVPAGWGPAPLRARRLLQSVIHPEYSPETGTRGHVQKTARGRGLGPGSREEVSGEADSARRAGSALGVGGG